LNGRNRSIHFRQRSSSQFHTKPRLSRLAICPGYTAEARRLLLEAAMLEPEADFVRDRIKALP
jgi:hypothetical protein